MTTPEQERAHWDVLAADPANVGGGPGMPGTLHFIAKLNEWRVPGVALDLGCGVGRLLGAMSDLHVDSHFAGVDVSVHMAAQVAPRPNVLVHVGDGRTIPEEIGDIQFAWSVLMFQHIPQTAQIGYVRQVADRLTSGGRFVLQWVDRGADHDYSRPTPGPMMLKWATEAGLDLLAMWRDELVSDWLWAVWEKP